MMKVVLLLDASLTSGDNVHFIDINETVIVALRLLSFLSNRVKDPDHSEGLSPSPKTKRTATKLTSKSPKHEKASHKKPNFKWGFKFFSSVGSVVRAKFSKKTSFTTILDQDSFDSFQKDVEAVFKNEIESRNKRTSLTHPSERLTTALTEILHDFEWQDKSDLLKSPGRSLRKRTSHVEIDESNDDRQNIVLIFSKVPSSRQCLRRFSNKVVIDSDVFIDSFMSPALLEEYRDKSRINVHWVDFNTELIDKATRDASLNIVIESLKKLGGNLLHKLDILKSVPSNTTNFTFTESQPPASILPAESILLQLSKDRVSPDAPLEDIDKSLFVAGCSKLELTGAKLTPFRNANDSAICESGTFASAPKNECSDVEVKLCLADARLELQGFVSSNDSADLVSNLEMHQSTVLTCDDKSRIGSLLRMLIKSQHVAILKISRNQDDIHFQMAVLTALTSTCGHIFLVSWNQQLDLEKALLFNKAPTDSCTARTSKPLSCHVLNSWHKPGTTGHVAKLVEDLRNGPSYQKRSSLLSDVLGKVKQMYIKTEQDQKQQSAPLTSTPITGLNLSALGTKIGGSAESESGSSSSQTQTQQQMRRGLSRRSSSSLSRGRLLVERARSASLLMAGEEEGSSNQSSASRLASPAGRRTSGSAGFDSLNIQTEEELLDYLNKQYSQVLGAGVAMEASIQAMLTVTCYFMSTKEMATNPQKSAIVFIRKYLALDSVKLKEKYGNATDVDKKAQSVEYKMQVMLLLEMASFVPDNEDFQGERLLNALVSMLRVLSFIIGPTSIREFMASISDSYCGTLPRVLMDVYDELDLPYPGALAKLTSPSAPSTVWGPNMSVGSVDSFHSGGPSSSQPPSSGRLSQGNRRTSLKQHPSLTDFRQKKQILVEKPKSKPVSKTEGKKSAKDKNKQQKGKSSKSRSAVDVGGAKRNLFSDKSKVKKIKDRLQLTPKGKSGKPKMLVPGTPAHKQTSARILSRQKRVRDHYNIKPSVQVVAESPLKDDDPHCSVDNKPARFLLRESFYSSNSQQSRIVAKSMEMEEKGGRPATSPHRFLQPSRSHGSLISAVRGESPILSPRSRMMKSFLASPSSEGKSNKKKPTTPNPSTPPSHLPRRSPRKSVKKLLFHNTLTATKASSSWCQESAKKQEANVVQNTLLDAKLVFDGENASDAPSTSSPVKNSKVYNPFGVKTPEKRNHPTFCAWETSSCPPLQVTPTKPASRKQVRTPELSFKNVFNPPGSSNTSPGPKFGRNSPRKKLCSHDAVNNSPSKLDSGHDFYKMSGSGRLKVGLKKSVSDSSRVRKMDKDFLNLQKRISPQKAVKRVSPQKAVGYSSSGPRRVSSGVLRFSDSRSNTSRRDSFSTSVNRNEIIDVDDGEIVLSTPKKNRHDSYHSSFQTTPSKVKFSDSFISPPTGSGRPVALTPTRSILKSSPNVKNQSFVRRIQLTDSEPQKLPDKNFLSPSSKKSSFDRSPNKRVTSLNFGDQTSKFVSRVATSQHETPNKSPCKQTRGKVESLANKVDDDSSSSTCESSPNTSARQEQPSTVVTAHTPSPSNKCKTPESINKWVRKKRNSGNRSVSSSSSSSVSPSSSSNEFKDKESAKDGGSEDVKGETVSITKGKTHKRNLFLDAPSLSSELGSPSRKRGKIMHYRDENSFLPGKEENDITERDFEGYDQNIKLFSHRSGGFSHKGERVLQSQEEASMCSGGTKVTTEQSACSSSNLSSRAQHAAPFSCFSPSRSPSKRRQLLPQNSSFMGEGSQGFFVESENPDSSHATSSRAEMPSASTSSEQGGESPSSTKLSVDVGKSPGNGKASPIKKQQYSPALTTSGLLQLIRSPLVEDTKVNNPSNSERKKTRSAKSRKHLDWPM